MLAALDNNLGPAGDRGWLSTGQGPLSGAVPWGQQDTKVSSLRGARALGSAGHARAGPAPPDACAVRHRGMALGMAGRHARCLQPQV